MSSSSDDENKNSRLLRVRIRRLPAVAGGVPDSIVAYVGAMQRVLRSPTTATVVHHGETYRGDEPGSSCSLPAILFFLLHMRCLRLARRKKNQDTGVEFLFL